MVKQATLQIREAIPWGGYRLSVLGRLGLEAATAELGVDPHQGPRTSSPNGETAALRRKWAAEAAAAGADASSRCGRVLSRLGRPPRKPRGLGAMLQAPAAGAMEERLEACSWASVAWSVILALFGLSPAGGGPAGG